MDGQKIKRINELYRKSKAEGLTEAERLEQKLLRTEYLEAVKQNLRGQPIISILKKKTEQS